MNSNSLSVQMDWIGWDDTQYVTLNQYQTAVVCPLKELEECSTLTCPDLLFLAAIGSLLNISFEQILSGNRINAIALHSVVEGELGDELTPNAIGFESISIKTTVTITRSESDWRVLTLLDKAVKLCTFSNKPLEQLVNIRTEFNVIHQKTMNGTPDGWRCP